MRNVPLKEWTDALRSGDYTQGEGYLCKDGAYCCLGVLADLAGVERTKWKDCITAETFNFILRNGQVKWDTMVIPDELRASIVEGLDLGRDPQNRTSLQVQYNHSFNSVNDILMHANDGGQPFSKIADLIETLAAEQAACRE